MVEIYPNRRQVLKSVGGTGAVLGSNYLITGNVIAEDSHDRKRRQLGEVFKSTEDRQKKHQGGGNVETEKKYYTIPRSQWIRVETAQTACKRLSREMLELEPSGLVTVSVVSEYNRPKSEKRLNVEYTRIKRKLRDGSEETIAEPSVDYEEVETESPYTVSGGVEDQEGQAERKLEVSVTEQTLYEQNCQTSTIGNYYYSHYYDQCPGGASVSTDSSGGTSCAPGNHSQGHVIVTAAHIPDTDVGDKVYQPNGDLLGEVISRSYSGDGDPYPSDGVAILIDGSRWFYYGLASDSGDNTYWRDIDGTLSWDAIKDMEDNALEQMEKQGKRTGRCAGKVTATYNPGSIRYFTTAAKNASGDSGGVHFHIDNTGDTLVSGIHKGDANGDAMAPFIKDQYDELGLTFF